MAITVGEIKKTDINPVLYQTDTLNTGTSVTYSLLELIKNIIDGDFLKYIPDQYK